MKDIRSTCVWGVILAAGIAGACGCSKADAQEAADGPTRTIDLTVYKEDFAMVSENRPVAFGGGHSRIAIDDMSKELDPKSVLFDWPNSANHPDVVGTTYNLGVGDGTSLLSRLNGQQVEMTWPSDDGKPGEVISGRLEAAQGGNTFALRTKDKLYVNPGGTIVASANTASTLPQLAVDLESPSAGQSQVGLSYLTRGMSWSADYVAKLDPVADLVYLECWATVTNTTGVAFPHAKLTLMAGSPNREVENIAQTRARVMADESVSSPVSSAKGFARDTPRNPAAIAASGELYAYKIPSSATIDQDQMNRVSMFGAKAVPIKRDYAIRIPTLSPWGYEFDGAQTQPHVPATLSIAFVNQEASNLGFPLPSGSVRVYEKDSEGQEQYTGAASLADISKREHVNLTLTGVFDVYAGYKVLKSQRVDRHTVRKSVQFEVHNEKKAPLEVRIVQSYESPWTPVVESDKSEKVDGQTVQWKILVKPGETRTVNYTVNLRD